MHSLTSAIPLFVVVHCLVACTPSLENAVAFHIEPETPSTNDELRVDFDYVQQNYRWQYLWFRAEEGSDDFLRVDEVEEDTVPHELTRRGERWQVAVVSNETGTQTVQKLLDEAKIITIANSPPVVTVELDNASPTTIDPVVATASHEDADGDDVEYDFIWQRQDGFQTNLPTLDPANTSVNDHWTVTVTGRDNADPAGISEEVSADFTVRNSPPQIDLISLTEGPTYEDSDLRVEITASDVDEEQALTHSIEWVVDGQVVLSNTPRLTGEHFGKAQQVLARVATSDGIVSSQQVHTDTRIIANTPPFLMPTGTVPEPLREGVSPDCSESSLLYDAYDIDDDPVTTTVEWEVNGQTLAETTSSISSEFFEKGDTVTCHVTPSDGDETGEAQAFPFGLVLNTAPLISNAGVALRPESPTTTDSLETAPVEATDPDNQDTVTFQYTWTRNGVAQQIGPSNSLDSSYFTRGDLIAVEVVPSDGTDSGPAVSTSVTIENSPPAVDSVSLQTFQYGPIKTNNSAVARHVGSDSDNDFIQYFYDWSVNGVLLFTGTNNILDSSNFEKDNTISVVVTPHDGTESGPPSTLSVVVANTPPTAPNLYVSTQTNINPDPNLSIASDFQCLVLVDSVDADDDPISYSFHWEKDGVVYLDGFQFDSDTESLLSTQDIYPQQEWTCSATPSDPEEPGAPGQRSLDIPVPCGSLILTDSDYAYTSSFPTIPNGRATAEFWFQTIDNSSTPTGQRLMYVDGGGWTVDFCKDGYTISTLGSSFGGLCASYLSVDQWYHLAVRIKANGDVSALLDGSPLPLLDGPGTASFTGGSSATFGSLDGGLGEIRIWERALSDTEIVDGMTHWPHPDDEPQLGAWWSFTEHANSTTVADSSGNGHFATVVGSGWNFSLEQCPAYP